MKGLSNWLSLRGRFPVDRLSDLLLNCRVMPGYARRVLELEGRQLLRDWIERSTRTQRQAADFIGVHEVLLAQWLRGTRRPSLEIAFDVEAKTGVPARSWTLSRLSKMKMAGRGDRRKP